MTCRQVTDDQATRRRLLVLPPPPPAVLAPLIDHTLLRPDAGPKDVETLCQEAVQFGFASVCVNPAWVGLAASILRGGRPTVCTVVGFPLGATTTEVKAVEAGRAIESGAGELDMVLPIGALRSGDHRLVRGDIRAVVEAAAGQLVKVILETCLLTDEEKVLACRLAEEAGAAYVKTSTGFAAGGATERDVALLREAVGDRLGVKASGGIRSLTEAMAMLAAGADRLGTSAGVRIVGGGAG